MSKAAAVTTLALLIACAMITVAQWLRAQRAEASLQTSRNVRDDMASSLWNLSSENQKLKLAADRTPRHVIAGIEAAHTVLEGSITLDKVMAARIILGDMLGELKRE